ncbi:hypothetical protein D3C84_1213920 [compost metagenome]
MPAHGGLDEVMQLAQRAVATDQQAAPDGRIEVQRLQLDVQDETNGLIGHGCSSNHA